VRIQAVDRQAQQLAVHGAEGLGVFGEADELGGANRREIGRVREQDQPLAFVVGERAVTVGGLGVESGGGFVEAGEGGNVFHGVLHSGRVSEEPGKQDRP
jgi:hypothetical protein